MFARIHLVVSLFSGIHFSCIPGFPFDPPMQSDTLDYTAISIFVLFQSVHKLLLSVVDRPVCYD